MAIHLCRDIVTTHRQPDGMLALMGMFMTGVLGCRVIGQTNFQITTSVGGTGASINMGAGNENSVLIPAPYAVTASDLNKVLALRSNANPRHNSGLFRVVAVNTSSNYVIVDYRTSGSNPPAEAGTLEYTLFASESTFLAASTANTSSKGEYRGDRDATNSRIIYASPHSSSWQVRITREVDNGGLTSAGDAEEDTGFSETNLERSTSITFAPGMNGNSAGDFPRGSLNRAITNGEHLHGFMWFNRQNYIYSHTTVGIGLIMTDLISTLRFSAWGDDATGTTIFAYRIASNSYAYNNINYTSQWSGFGMVDQDSEPLPPKTIQRLFAFGHTYNLDSSAVADRPIHYGTINWKFGPPSQTNVIDGEWPARYTAVTFGLNDKPVSACPSPYVEIGGAASEVSNDSDGRAHIIDVPFAVDNALLGATELQTVDLYAGTFRARAIQLEVADSVNGNQFKVFEYDPRRMGTFPLARMGRANFGSWVTTTDVNRSWIHLSGGVYMPWEGPAPL